MFDSNFKLTKKLRVILGLKVILLRDYIKNIRENAIIIWWMTSEDLGFWSLS